MAIVSGGYDGSLDEVGVAAWHAAASSRPGIVTGVSLTVVGNVDRTVRVGAGQAYGFGVLDTITGNTDLQCEAVTSGSRWDTLVLRRDWRPAAGGPSALMLLKGTSTQGISALAQNTPGVLHDQILALVRVQSGLTTIQELVDLREWPESLAFLFNRGLPDPARYAYGDKILVNPGDSGGLDVGVRRGGAGTEVWDMLLSRPWTNLSLSSGYVALDSSKTPQYRVVGDKLELRGLIKRSNGSTFDNTYRTVASIPASSSPTREAYVPCGSNFSSATGGGGMCNIQASGVVQINAPQGLVTWVSLDGISLSIG